MAAKTESYGAPGAVAADGSKIDAFGRRVAEGGAAEPPAKRRRVVLPIEAKPDDARHPGDAKLVEQLLPRLRDFLGVGDADDGPFDRSLLEDALRKVLGVYGVDRLMSLPEGRRVEEEMSLLERAMNFVLDHQTRSAGPSNAGGSSAFGSASRAALEAKPAPEPASLSTVDLCGDGANSELEASSMASPERGSGGYISLSDDDEPDEPATSFIDIGGVKVTVSGPPAGWSSRRARRTARPPPRPRRPHGPHQYPYRSSEQVRGLIPCRWFSSRRRRKSVSSG
ncbi:hypothetical protein DFJ74DRAFT_325128 [Hyaloraphidium curvatum]|nr:hypothetical protein DFJ74DRAFT_325128 [Hyaloraphidium curvatum]